MPRLRCAGATIQPSSIAYSVLCYLQLLLTLLHFNHIVTIIIDLDDPLPLFLFISLKLYISCRTIIRRLPQHFSFLFADPLLLTSSSFPCIMTSALERVPPETPERKELLERLQRLEPRVCDMKTALYNEAELNELNISIEPFTLNENGEPAFRPCFFDPFKGELKDDPHVAELEDDEWEWQPYRETNKKSPVDWAQLTFEYWQDYMFAQTFEFRKRTGLEVPAIVCRSYVSS